MNEKEFEVVKNKIVQIGRVEIEPSSFNPEQIQRIRFKTDAGDITWKPKIKKEEYRDGIVVLKSIPMEMDFLPDKIKQIGKILQDGGLVKMKVQFMKMTTEEEIEYRFIRSEKTLAKWTFEDVSEVVNGNCI